MKYIWKVLIAGFIISLHKTEALHVIPCVLPVYETEG